MAIAGGMTMSIMIPARLSAATCMANCSPAILAEHYVITGTTTPRKAANRRVLWPLAASSWHEEPPIFFLRA